jgi:predicted branched-subunit amino acid permease
MHLPLWQRLMTGYLTADLSYVLFVRRYPQPGRDAAQLLAQQAYLSGNCGVNWLAWVSCSLLGVGLSNWVPISWGLGFAGILALLGILCSLASSRLRVVSAGVAGAAAVVAYALPLKMNILVAIASAVALCLMVESATLLKKDKP